MVAHEDTLVRRGGMALAAGGVLFAVATVLHPAQETPSSILEMEARLVASHALYIVAFLLILLGLPMLFSFGLAGIGRLGFSGFVIAWVGTALLAISSQFGFLAPPLAVAPGTLDRVIAYPPVIIFNGAAAVVFMVGYIFLGIALGKSTAFPGRAGLFVGAGAPAHLASAGAAQLGPPGLWLLAVVGAIAFGAGLALCGVRMASSLGARSPALPSDL